MTTIVNIVDEARKHMLSFLNKVLAGTYTRSEFESFSILGYQTEELESLRQKVLDIISQPTTDGEFQPKKLDEFSRKSLTGIIEYLERYSV